MNVVHVVNKLLFNDLHSAQHNFSINSDGFGAINIGERPMIRLDGSVNSILDVILKSLKKHFNFDIVIGVVMARLLKFLSYI